MQPSATAPLAADILVAGAAVVTLFYALRGIGHLPVVARLLSALALTFTVLGSFGLVLLTFGAGGHAFVRQPRLPWSTPAAGPDVTGPIASVSTAPARAAVPAATPPAVSTPAVPTPAAASDTDSSVAASDGSSAADPAAATARSSAPADAGDASATAGPATKLARAEPEPPPAVVPPTSPVGEAPHAPPAPPTMPAGEAMGRTAILFGTDRAPDGDGGHRFGAARGGKLLLGRAALGARAHVPDDGIETLSRAEWLRRAGEAIGPRKRALVVVHGYNTSLETALARAEALARDIGSDGLVAVYSWPSQGRVPSYSYDADSARGAEPFLREFLSQVVAAAGPETVSVIGEGIGAGPLLSALADIEGAPPPGLMLDQVLLAAPDLDARRLQALVAKLGATAKGLTLYATAQDRALAVARRFHGGLPRAGDIAAGEPLVLAGVDSIAVGPAAGAASGAGASPSSAGATKDDAGASGMVADMAALLRAGTHRPPDRRGALQRVAARGGGYFWRIAH